MNNNHIYPFERNRYYAGKMLTSADFQAEQTYLNNKRRFLNNLMYGPGIICGCGVFSLDDLSLLVESGAAIDGLGREIVIESSVVKKLSAIEGFEQLQTDRVSLCVRYKEKEVHTVYAVNSQNAESEYEYNRISEEYQLFLMDSEGAEYNAVMETEFLVKGALLETEDFLVEYIMPATVCRGKNVRAVVRVEKLSHEDKQLSFRSVLQVPAFDTPDGAHEIEVELKDIFLAQGESIEREYWMKAQDTPLIDTNVMLKSGSGRATIDNSPVAVPSGVSLKIMIADCQPRDLVNRELGRCSLEMKNIENGGDYIKLADLKLVRTDSAYLIEEVLEDGVKKYIPAPAQDKQRNDYLSYFYKEAEITSQGISAEDAPKYEKNYPMGNNGPEVATGILEIPLGEEARRGDVCYSGEIIHGLGKGNVYVEIGYEYIAEDAALGHGAKSTIYGNPELFRQDKQNTVDAETAVKVMNDKGSFIVAAKLLQNVDYLILTYRWVAIKFPSGNDLGVLEDYSGKSIAAVTPTVVMGTKESYFFDVKYNNMENCSVLYELTESGSGEITSEGVYTAPSKEGVYEIRIYCADMPVICTYAYAIVKKKSFEDSEA